MSAGDEDSALERERARAQSLFSLSCADALGALCVHTPGNRGKLPVCGASSDVAAEA